MTSKIDFYREVLLDDPSSRVFFPLARMLAERGETEEAVAILKEAIGFHPGHLEARFLLVELLSRLELAEEASVAFESVVPLLSNYPSVWTLWASKATGLSRDSSLALRLLAQNLAGKEVSFLDLLEKGMQSVSGAAASGRGEEPRAPSSDDFSLRGVEEVQALAKRIQEEESLLPREDLPPECGQAANDSVKTLTMADLLAKHGDYAEALTMYGELLGNSANPLEKASIEKRIVEVKALADAGAVPAREDAVPETKSKAKLVSMLEALANRLDARAIA